jgi:hypothetical protein
MATGAELAGSRVGQDDVRAGSLLSANKARERAMADERKSSLAGMERSGIPAQCSALFMRRLPNSSNRQHMGIPQYFLI